MAQTKSKPRKTVEDYLALPDDVRAELIDGELYVTPSPTPHHQDAAGLLYAALLPYAREHGHKAYIAPLDVHLPTGDIVQPDVLLARASNLGIIQDWIRGVPDVAVEVVSPTHPERDRFVKRHLYARNGVPSYWIVEPDTRTIEVLALDGDAYRPEAYFQGDQVLESPALPGFRLPLADVFAAPAAPPD